MREETNCGGWPEVDVNERDKGGRGGVDKEESEVGKEEGFDGG